MSNPSPEPDVWLWKSLSYGWLGPLFKISKDRELEQDDLFDLPPSEQTKLNTDKFQVKWTQKLNKTPKDKLDNGKLATHFKWSLWSIVRRPMILAGFYRFVNSLIQLTIPFLLAELLQYIDEVDERPVEEGIFWALSLGVISSLKAFAENRFFWCVFRGGWQARSVVSSAVFNKSLRLSASARQALSQGQIVNLMQLDAEKLEKFAPNVHVVWDAVLQIAGYCTVIYFYIEESVFLGLAVLLLTIPIQAILYLKLFGYLKKVTSSTDERVKLTNEALISMLAIKTAGWEFNFTDRISDIRNKELKPLRDSLIIRSVMLAVIISVPSFTAVAGLSYFGLTRGDNAVSAAVLFASIQGFNSLRFPLFQIPTFLTTYSDAKVSQNRLARFLALDEKENAKSKSADKKMRKGSSDGGIEIKDGEFFWTTEKKIENFLMDNKKDAESKQDEDVPIVPALVDINLSIPDGALVGVVGTVGSGKSTLLNAFLGEMTQTKGTSKMSSSSAFAAQTAWILNATVKENIVFGEEFDSDRYDEVLRACQLKKDLKLLEDGDQTEIGERGINLSGGQKQRVSVARAAYSSSNLVLLDDPLSALDPEVAAKMFEECIVKFLKGRTRIMVTNQLNFLKQCDYVVGLDNVKGADGGSFISTQGTFDNLMANDKHFAELINSFQGEEKEENVVEKVKKEAKELNKLRIESKLKEAEQGKDLMQKEERESGSVKLRYYWKYIKAGGVCIFFLAIILLSLGQSSALVNVFVLRFWSQDPFYEDFSLGFYLGIYASSAVISSIFYFFQTYIFYFIGVRASRALHQELITGVFKAPMSFFDTTPTGRIVSRFTRDLFSLDTELPQTLVFFMFMLGLAVSSVIAIGVQVPLFLALLPVIAIFYLYIMRIYRPIARGVKRLESISRSPIYAQFGETLNGLSSIRAYGKADEFKARCEQNIDSSLKATYVFKALERWIAIRMELMSAFIIAATSCFIVYAASEGQINAGIAGVSLNMVLTFTNIVSGIVRSFVTVEAIFNSVERIDYYSNHVEKEKEYISDTPPDDSWPTKGEINVSQAVMRYRNDTPIVLKGVNFVVPGGSTCGVVGRTGSGKSSIMLILLRIVELESGTVSVDGLNIGMLGLHELRHKISMVPQNPVIFSGTVRLNLDPFELYSDDQLWGVLKQVNLEAHIRNLPGQLSSEVVEYGENFSQGQRQLMCMARSLLAKAKVLLLDEATSSVDYETDAVIQDTIRKSFTGCTILTIAHRIQTIADYDNVMVMDDGKVAEFGPPVELLRNSSSEFSKIVKEMGPSVEEKIKKMVLSQ